MGKKILVIQGHPDTGARHFCHALAAAYQRGAREAGHEVSEIEVARLTFPLLGSQEEWERGHLPNGLEEHPCRTAKSRRFKRSPTYNW